MWTQSLTTAGRRRHSGAQGACKILDDTIAALGLGAMRVVGSMLTDTFARNHLATRPCAGKRAVKD